MFFCLGQEFAVFDSFPTAILDGYALVAGKDVTDRYRQALIQQDEHVYELDRRAISDRSKTLQATSRVTDGKQARNSSSV